MRTTGKQRKNRSAAAQRANVSAKKSNKSAKPSTTAKTGKTGKTGNTSKTGKSGSKSKSTTAIEAVVVTEQSAQAPLPRFPIVGIGASAGGIDAFTQLLAHVPADTGMAFILVQHLDPEMSSFLAEHMRRATSMPVLEARDQLTLKQNHVYVAPPGCEVALVGTTLSVTRTAAAPDEDPSSTGMRRAPLPIDAFFRSLAKEARSKAVGVVLSGMGHDGTAGLRAIEAENGVSLVQDPSTARFAAMPHSAAGAADFVLALPQLAAELARLSKHPFVRGQAIDPFGGRLDAASLQQAFDLLRKSVGVDFAEYKDTTLRRRIARRMALRQKATLAEYVGLLRADPAELRALFDDALVHVTTFFREPELFEELKRVVFPEIMKHKVPGAPVRMWVAGCSTGEEVYSLAMAFLEYQTDARISVPLQLFASDVSDRTIEKARAGVYSESAMHDVGTERTRRFFVKVDNGFRISKTVRDLCVFVRHDLARDPPFSRLDLASCRNLLIYFNQPLQKRVIATMHYCLNQPGFLVLGHTENAGTPGQLFTVVDKVDKALKVFARNAVSSSLHFPRTREPGVMLASQVAASASANGRGRTGGDGSRAVDLPKHVDNLLLSQYAPAGVIVNEAGEVLQFRGRTGPYLEPAPGSPQNNLLKMVREGLLADLRIAFSRVKKERTEVRRDDVSVKLPGGGLARCNIVALPVEGLPEDTQRLYVVLFEETSSQGATSATSATSAISPSTPSTPSSRSAARSSARSSAKKLDAHNAARQQGVLAILEEELKSTKEHLHSVVEDHQRANDELSSANEELVSSNEELQSMNEELETAKEEMQSANEELTTVNDELHNRNKEMGQLNNDLSNILASVEIPLVILDGMRRIRRFTPRARALMNLVPTDVGRPIDDIRANVNFDALDSVVADVIETMTIVQREVQDRDGRWHRLQIRPYRTVENRIDGAIISLIDIDDLKTALARAEVAKKGAEQANGAKDLFLATVSHELRTPLSAMLMQAQLIKGGTLSTDEVRAAAEAIEQSTKLQVQLVDDLLDVSRMVSGRLAIERSTVNLATVVRTSVGAAAPLAQGKSVAIDTQIEQASVHVAGDFGRLQQVVWNLLANAVKYSDAGGRVAVRLAIKQKQAEVRVVDDGVGIDPEFLPLIFTRFARADDGRATPHGGLGLGLAIARHIVEMHGGTVRAESAGKDRGTTMVVQLPLLVSS